MNINDIINKDYYLYFELTNIDIIKTLFESFDKNVDIVRFILSKKNFDSELEITCTNTTRTYYFKSKFGNKLIKNFIFDDEKIEIELLPNDLANILKSYDSNDNLLLFYVNNVDNKKNTMVIEFKQHKLNNSTNYDGSSDSYNYDTDNSNEKTKTKTRTKTKKTKKLKKTKKDVIKEKKFTIKIGYPIYPEKQMTKISFDKKITINPNKFHNVCKDLGTLFDYVKISSKNNKNLYLEYDTSRCDGIIKFKYDKSNVVLENITNLKNNNISGVYHIEDIIAFSKLSSITTDYYFKLKNNYFLESTYVIGEYGTIIITYIPLKEDMVKTTLSISNNIDNSDNSDNLSNLSNSSGNNEIENNNRKFKKKTINDKIIYFEIDKIELFKSLCECIEKIITEPIFKLETVDDKFTIKIICANNSKNINLNIRIENIFDRFKKLDKTVNLGIGLKYLNDILKTTDKNNKLILSIDEQDKHNLIIQIKNKNDSDKIELKQIYKIKLLNIEEDENPPIIKFDNNTHIISIKPNEFYKICKDINTIGDEIKIVCDGGGITFSTIGDCGYINMIKKDNGIIDVKTNKNNVDTKIKIINEFEIKDIMILSKLSSMMNDFDIYFKQDGRMVIKSNFIDSMGSINIQYLSKNILDIKPNDKNMLKSDIDNMDDKFLFFKLKKINFMKNIIDTLDKMVSDVEWVFTSNGNLKKDSGNEEEFVGLEITCTDPSKTLYVKTKLTNELFKSYYCEKKIFKFGMSLEYFNKILKLVDKNDIAIYCYIEKSDPDNLIVRIKNLEKKNKRIFKIPLQIVIKDNKNQMTLDFEKKITLCCDSLFSKCKMISNNSQFVKICCVEDKLLFKCVGDKDGCLTLDTDDDDSLEIVGLNNDPVECIYDIKNILLFSRLSSITENFSFYMKNNFALTSIFNFGDCGVMYVILSPSSEEYINNQSYEYSDDDDDDVQLLNTSSNIMNFY